MAYTVVEVNAWTLRCMFNESHIIARHEKGEFVRITTKSRPSKTPNHPKDTRSEHVEYRNENKFPFVWMRKCYGWVRRKIICPVFGPLAVLPEATVSLLLIGAPSAV